MQNLSILIVDDNPEFHYDVGLQLRRFCTLNKALDIPEMRRKLAGRELYDIILLDLALDETKDPIGLDLIPDIRKAQKDARIIVVTKFYNKPEYIVRATRLGAVDFIDKNTITPDELIAKIQKAMDGPAPDQEEEKDVVQEEDPSNPKAFIGQSSRIAELKKILERIGQLPKTAVLITGETGTGKEVAARYLHRKSPRKNKPFIGVNLSATPENLLESALFGHVKGSFTDAYRDSPGFFREADGGVILLDEIGDISPNVQVKLLRVIEERVIRPVGSDKDIPVDVHLLTATHKNLAEAVEQGRFRADLYQRLKSLTIEIPPLRDRKEDLPLLLQHYLRYHDPNLKITDFFEGDVIERFRIYPWPGNIRELRSAVEHCFVWRQIYDKRRADFDCLPVEIKDYSAIRNAVSQSQPPAWNQFANINTPSVPEQSIPQSITFISKKEENAYLELREIESAMQFYNKVKTDVASKLEYKGTDGLRNRIRTLAKQFPHLFDHFPLTRQEFASVIS